MNYRKRSYKKRAFVGTTHHSQICKLTQTTYRVTPNVTTAEASWFYSPEIVGPPGGGPSFVHGQPCGGEAASSGHSLQGKWIKAALDVACPLLSRPHLLSAHAGTHTEVGETRGFLGERLKGQ